jgi:2-dehydro-3-deoxygluconokinase
MSPFNIKSPNACKYDGVALGEVMLRLVDPHGRLTRKARSFDVYHGGGEINVAEGLASCFGLRTTVFTALVKDGIGENIACQLQEAGVDTSHIIWFKSDGVGRICNGINFTTTGKGVLPSKTEYYRAHTAIREVKPGDINWEKFFKEEGTRVFHTGGIYTLISPTSSEVAKEALKIAGKYGVFRSFDLNYRSKVEPDKEKARRINREIISEVDFIVGNQSDFFDALGYETKKVEPTAPFEVWLEAYAEMIKRVARDYPNLKLIGTQLRGAISADRINWGAILYDVTEDKIYQASVRENVEIMDRTGGGDSFVSGTLAALLNGKSVAEAVDWGAAHGILVQETPGDTTMVSQEEVLSEIARSKKGGGVTALR